MTPKSPAALGRPAPAPQPPPMCTPGSSLGAPCVVRSPAEFPQTSGAVSAPKQSLLPVRVLLAQKSGGGGTCRAPSPETRTGRGRRGNEGDHRRGGCGGCRWAWGEGAARDLVPPLNCLARLPPPCPSLRTRGWHRLAGGSLARGEREPACKGIKPPRQPPEALLRRRGRRRTPDRACLQATRTRTGTRTRTRTLIS